MTEGHDNYRLDLRHIQGRVRKKLKDHVRYDFSPLQNNLLKSFFDLVQEYDGLDDFYRIAVVVLLESMQVESALYLLDNDEKQLTLVCNSREGIVREQRPIPTGIYLSDKAYKTENSYVVPIYRKPPKAHSIEGNLQRLNQKPWQKNIPVLGMFEIYPLAKLTEEDMFFLKNQTPRI